MNITIHPRYLKHGALRTDRVPGSKRRYILRYGYFAAKLRGELQPESHERVMRGKPSNPTALHY